MKIGPFLAEIWPKTWNFESGYPPENRGCAFIGGGAFIGECTVYTTSLHSIHISHWIYRCFKIWTSCWFVLEMYSLFQGRRQMMRMTYVKTLWGFYTSRNLVVLYRSLHGLQVRTVLYATSPLLLFSPRALPVGYPPNKKKKGKENITQ